jgi:hypothetical protein
MNFIRKIKDYDFQKNMKFYYRESRDIWMSIAISKALELEFMEKVADNWQAKLIDQNSIIGKRLKFSVGHNHIEIVVGNPTTYIENCNTEFEEFTYQWTVSRCSHKDTYNWKTGVIEALDNLCVQSEYSHKLQRDLRKALAKKYPEIFEVSK